MDRRIERVLADIDLRLAEPWDVRRLAETVNLSPSRFSHLFFEEVGISPMRHVHRRRMERARELLERTALSVKEVMVHVGCSDPSHFARDFRRYHGVAPRECRRAGGDAHASDDVPHDVSASSPSEP